MLPVQFDKAKCFRKSHHKAKPRKQIARLACVQSQDQLLTQLRVAGRVAVCAMAIWVEIPKHNGGFFEKWGKSSEKKRGDITIELPPASRIEKWPAGSSGRAEKPAARRGLFEWPVLRWIGCSPRFSKIRDMDEQ